MFFSSLLANNIYNNHRREYLDDDKKKHQPAPVNTNSAGLVLFAIVFLLELALAIFALVLAWRCGKKHEDRFVHLVVAFFFPIIYILYYYITGCGKFDGCGKGSNGSSDSPSPDV